MIVQESHLTSVLAGSAGTDPIRVISMADADGAVALAFHRFGPYHRARLQAVRTRLTRVEPLEFSSVDESYARERVRMDDGAHVSLFVDADVGI